MKKSNKQQKTRVAIIGLRHLHPESYLKLFRQLGGVEVTGVVESDEAHRKAFEARHGIPGHGTIEEILSVKKPDIAAIFLPHDECAEASEKCAEAGIHLMVEKPFASTVEQAQRIKDTAEKNKVHVTTGYCWRFHPAVQVLMEILKDGTIGPVISLEGRCAAGRLDRYIVGNSEWILDKARSGGGPLYNLGVHWIDLFRYLMGSEVTEVSGEILNINKEFDVEDACFAHLRFDNGALATLNTSYVVPEAYPYGRDLYIAIHGEHGTVSWSPAYEGERDRLDICSDSGRSSGASNRSVELELDKVEGYSGYMGAAYVANFLGVVRGEISAPLISSDDAVAVLKVAETIYAAAENKRWMPIN